MLLANCIKLPPDDASVKSLLSSSYVYKALLGGDRDRASVRQEQSNFHFTQEKHWVVVCSSPAVNLLG